MANIITNLVKTCDACPAQWEAATVDNRPVYVRYRWGTLWLYIGNPGGSSAFDGECVFCESIGDSLHGAMSTEEMLSHLAEFIQLRG